jgi:hypothetical protein
MKWGDKTRLKEALFYDKRAKELKEVGMMDTSKMFTELAEEVRSKVYGLNKDGNNTGS